VSLDVLVVDDEEPARRRLRALLADVDGVGRVRDCADGPAAVAAIREAVTGKTPPDLLFLDVQMPEMDGFEVLRRVGVEAVGAVIFVTAHDRYALRAFDAHAVDYLLKPYTGARFREAVAQARRFLAGDRERAASRRRLAELLGLETILQPEPEPIERLPVRAADGRIILLPVDEIRWIEGEGNYARLHTEHRSHLFRATLKELADRLADHRFLRVHHSYLVHLDRVRELRPRRRGEYLVHLDDGTRLPTSRAYTRAVKRAFGL
jgi:two-component system LytT family response regulator